MNRAARLRGAWALTPLLVFLILYLGVSLWIGDFYKMPITVAFLAASAYGLCVIRRQPLEERRKTAVRLGQDRLFIITRYDNEQMCIHFVMLCLWVCRKRYKWTTLWSSQLLRFEL